MFWVTCSRRPRNLSHLLAQQPETISTSSTYDERDSHDVRISKPISSHPRRFHEPTSSNPLFFWHRRHLTKTIAVAIATNPIATVAIRARATLSDIVRSNSLKYLIAGVRVPSLSLRIEQCCIV